MRHAHSFGCEDLKSKNHGEIVQEGNNSFVIREVPIHRLFNAGQCGNASNELSGLSKGKNFSDGTNVMDYDIPELVVFLLGDHHHHHHQLVKGKCQLEECELDPNRKSCLFDPNMKKNSDSNLVTVMSSNSSGSLECASQHPCIMDAMKKCSLRNYLMMEGEVELDLGHKNSTDHSAKMMTSETLREFFRKEVEFSKSFKNWQINSFLGSISSRVECPHCTECQQFPQAEMWNLPPGPPTISGRASHQSNDSISSAHSFAFPILPAEWSGSPVRMLEADKNQSRKPQWLKLCFPCCK